MFNFGGIPQDDNGDEDRIPTYEEFLEEAAKSIQQSHSFQLIRHGFKIFQYVLSKERAFVEVLAEKGLWNEEDDETWEAKTEQNMEQFEGHMAKGLIKAAASGELRLPGSPEGISVSPDDAISMFNEFLAGDGNLSADSIRILLSFTGQSEAALKAAYQQSVASAKLSNKIRKTMRDLLGGISEGYKQETGEVEPEAVVEHHDEEADAAERELRTRRLNAYLNRVFTEGLPMPTLDELDKMTSGELEIPDGEY